MAKHRAHSIEFKCQVVQEFLGGESPHALAKRHGISRNLIKIWVAKCGIRAKAATESDGKRPPNPSESGHRFRSKAATLWIG